MLGITDKITWKVFVGNTIATPQVMGNGISQTQSPTKDREILVDDAPAGQFHRVLVEPDYCLPGPPTVKIDPHEASTLRVGTKPDSTTVEVTNQESTETNKPTTTPKEADKSFFSVDVDYAIIPDDEAELIPENGEEELDKPYVISVSTEDDDPVVNVIKDDAIHEVTNSKQENGPDLNKDIEKESNLEDKDTILSEKDELVKEETKDGKEKIKKDKKKKDSKTVLSMFKFSKHKPKVVAEFVPKVKAGKDQNEKISDNVQNHQCLIDSLKESSVDESEDVALIVDSDKNILIQKDPVHNHEKDNKTLSDNDKSGMEVSDLKDAINVERLNSLDSGIVVNGHHILQNDNHDVVNGIQDNDTVESPVKTNIQTEESKGVSDLKSKTSEDATDSQGGEVNETISVKDVQQQQSETVLFKSEDNKSDNQKTAESYEALESTDQDTTYSSLKDDEKDEQKAETGKPKKKSWSFQFGGNKKNAGRSSEKNASTTSVDKISSTAKKKSKSIFGKLSFRKSHDDVSMATDVDQATEGPLIEKDKTDPKKNKLKKIKAKKEKKGSLKKTIEEPEDGGTFSNDDSHLSDEINTPRSRRSIVELEEETPLVKNDAFEGVSLSDLSLDGDEVSTSPNGRELHDSPFDRELKRSLAKRAEKLLDNEQADATVHEASNTVHTVKVEIQQPDNKKLESLAKDEKATEKETKTLLEMASNKKDIIDDGEYATIKKDIPGSKIQVQQSEYANLHALPDVEPSLKENNDVKDELNNDSHDADNVKIVTEEAFVAINKENKTVDTNKALGDMLDSLERNIRGKKGSNIKEDIVTPEKSNTALLEAKPGNAAIVNEGETSPGAASNSPDESDAYVHLVQLVQDYKDDKFDKHLNNNGETLITGTNSVLINLTPMSSESKILPTLNTSSLNTRPQSPTHDGDTSARQKRGVVIMKEIGIQAPDIHIPMDIENDFGSVRHGELIDAGVQVSDNDLNDKDSKQDKLISPSISLESAYF